MTVNGLDGMLLFSPNADFNGSDGFAYTVSDGQGGSYTTTLNFAIIPATDNECGNIIYTNDIRIKPATHIINKNIDNFDVNWNLAVPEPTTLSLLAMSLLLLGRS